MYIREVKTSHYYAKVETSSLKRFPGCRSNASCLKLDFIQSHNYGCSGVITERDERINLPKGFLFYFIMFIRISSM